MTAGARAFVRGALVFNGVMLLIAGFALGVMPEWSFGAFAAFKPFSRHFVSDAGIFCAALGALFLSSAPRPERHTNVILVGAAVTLAHTGNHLIDHAALLSSWTHTVRDAAPLALGALWLLAALPATLRARTAP